jgi:hypothetical protein
MWKWLNKTVMQFKPYFSRQTSFSWFVIILVGIMIRSDHLGVSSIVRELSLIPSAYNSMIHFFRAKSWYIVQLRRAWLNIVKNCGFLIKEEDRYIIIGDGVKQAKEGRKMPGVSKLHQESDNSSKGEYIHGHMFGGLAILAGIGGKLFGILLSLKIHSGIGIIQEWCCEGYDKEDSHVIKMIKDAGEAVKTLRDSILLLDRLYLTRPMLEAVKRIPELVVVTKAKSNATAYNHPEPYKGRGRKPLKGSSVKLWDFFITHAGQFSTETIQIYGQDTQVRYYCVDLLWGKGLYFPLRFILTEYNGIKGILASTYSTFTPIQIIRLYGYRFKIECAFRELKQVVAGFSYHFWSKAMPKLNKFIKNAENQAILENIIDPRARKLIGNTVKAIEGYAQIGIIALGLLQLTSLMFGNEINSSSNRFMRTISSSTPSERTTADFMRKNIYQLFCFFQDLPLTSIISAKRIFTEISINRNTA